jgi:hypothetical protein
LDASIQDLTPFRFSASEWGLTEKNRGARFYALTAKGRRQLELEEESWSRLTEGVGRVLRYA